MAKPFRLQAPWLAEADATSKGWVTVAAALLFWLIAWLDYAVGYEISLQVFYLIPIVMVAWFVGRWIAMVLSVSSAAAWAIGSFAPKTFVAHPLIVGWNALMALGFYVVVAWLVGVLRSVLRDLEDRIRDRTASLLDEMAQRRRLETEVVEIAEREQRRIGVDLHDSLGQHLTAISIAVEVLRSDLKQPKEAAAAKKILELVENGIELTRSLARDMLPAELGTRDFATAFQKLADNTSQRYGVECRFASEGEVNLRDSALASQLYRIAQEAITNSIRHAKANRIDLRLAKIGGVLDLTIIDNGTGLRSSSGTDGLGVRIMAHRASVIGGTFEISNAAQGGASVRCRCPLNGTAVSTSATS